MDFFIFFIFLLLTVQSFPLKFAISSYYYYIVVVFDVFIAFIIIKLMLIKGC